MSYADQAIQMAKEVPAVYKGLQHVFEMMKNNQLQGQKGKMDAKIHHYKVFQGLTVSNFTKNVTI